MLGLFVKKWFFNLWDNLLSTLALNVLFVIPLLSALFLPGRIASLSLFLAVLSSLILFLLAFVYAGICNRFTLDFAAGRNLDINKTGDYLKQSWLPSLALGAIAFGLIFFFSVGVPFYYELDSTIGDIVSVLMSLVTLFIVLPSQYYWPLNAQLEPKIKKLCKKCLFLLFDNLGFTLFMLVGGLVITVLSVFSLTLFPGITGLLLWYQVGLKLRMYKYDYLGTAGQDPLRETIQIPWTRLLVAEREQTGSRSLKGMFFPWKE